MHPHQDDNLIVLQGTRHVDIYSLEHCRMEKYDLDTSTSNFTVLRKGYQDQITTD